jgi:hypothetical protein
VNEVHFGVANVDPILQRFCFPFVSVKKATLNTTAHKLAVDVWSCYGLDGMGIECRWGRYVPHMSRPVLGLPSLLYNGYRVFPGSKVARA